MKAIYKLIGLGIRTIKNKHEMTEEEALETIKTRFRDTDVPEYL